MSRRAWISAAVLAAAFWGLLIGGVFGCQASASSMADPNPFLELHGLHAELVPFEETTEMIRWGNSDWLSAGRYTTYGILVAASLPPSFKIRTALHEWLHGASRPVWDGVNCAETPEYCTEGFLRWYEEGLVEALTLHLLPGWGRYILGRPMRPETIAYARLAPQYQEAYRWLDAAAQATGTPRWSRASREWLVARLSGSLDERVAVLTGAA